MSIRDPQREAHASLWPTRVQRKRTKGWRMPPNTVYVGRPTKWGNPFRAGYENPMLPGRLVADKRHAWRLFQAHAPLSPKLVLSAKAELRGKNLACYCPLGEPCHVDVLLDIANETSRRVYEPI